MKKQKIITSILFVALLIVGIGVFAASDIPGRYYNSTLLIADGATLKGKVREYYEGQKAIHFSVDAVNRCTTCNPNFYTKLNTVLRDGNDTQKDYYVFSFTDEAIGGNYYKQFNDTQAGDRYYYFATKINNVRYSGFRSDRVIMVSAYPD